MSNSVGILKAPRIVPASMPEPRRVPFDAPWNWLAAGWRDIWRIPRISLTYGGAFAVTAAALGLGLGSSGGQSLFPALAGGILLIGPLVAVGLYDASRRLARGEGVRFRDVLGAGLAARGQLAFFGATLLFAFLVWMQLALLILMLFFGGNGLPPLSDFIHTLLFTAHGLGFLIVGSMVGGMIAALVFAMSVVSVPLLLVTQTDAVSAARASVAAVVRNPKPMALWAVLIVVIIAAGFVTFLVGLTLAFPLIGHATWHAYAEIYGDPPART